MKMLLYCDLPIKKKNAQTLIDHAKSFEKYSSFEVDLYSSRLGLPNDINLKNYQILVIHYSITLITSVLHKESYIPLKDQKKIRAFKGLKILFIQDEYRRVNHVCEKINFLKIDVLYSCAPLEISKKIYKSLSPKTTILETLTGYAPENVNSKLIKPHCQRNFDVFYRARKLPFWYGKLAQDKYEIGEKFVSICEKKLKLNISTHEKDRVYGDSWLNNLMNSTATLGTESGASIIDFTGDFERDIAIFKYYNPKIEFHELPKLYLESDGEIKIQVISPRIFEAIACKTLLILFPGNYSGVLDKNNHYLELEKDFSNINDVISIIKEKKITQEIVDCAYSDLIESNLFSYENFIKKFDKEIYEILYLKS